MTLKQAENDKLKIMPRKHNFQALEKIHIHPHHISFESLYYLHQDKVQCGTEK